MIKCTSFVFYVTYLKPKHELYGRSLDECVVVGMVDEEHIRAR